MRRLAIILVLTLLLAGCATIENAPGTPDAAAPNVGRFTPPIAMVQPTGGAEPNMAILPDGTIFITAVAGSQERPNHEQGAAWLWRSTDGGATWETLRAPQRDTPLGTPDAPNTRKPFGSSDADVVTSPDGWVYYSDWWNWGAPVAVPGVSRYGSYLVERSADGGATWESASVTTLDTVGGMDRQWLVAGPDGYLALFYSYFRGPNPVRAALDPASATDAPPQTFEAVYSRDHGATWTQPATVAAAAANHGLQIGHPRLTADGLLWMPYGDVDARGDFWTDPSEVRVVLSRDLGATWNIVTVASVPEGFDNLWAVQGDSDDAGNLHVAWAARDGERMTMNLASSTDGGATWGDVEVIRAEGLNFLPWVAARGDGDVAIAWYGGNATGDPTKANATDEWFVLVATREAGGAFDVVRAVDTPVKTGPMCPKGAACTGDRELLDYPSVAFAPDGRLHLSYAASREVGGVKAGHVHHTARATE